MRRRAWGRTVAAADRQALDVALSCKKNQQEEGPARVSPVAAPMPKSDSLREKREWLDCLVLAYLSLLGCPCIYSRCLTGWIVNGVCSHWKKSFPHSQP